MDASRILIITGHHLPHRFFIHTLQSKFSISAVFLDHFTYPKPSPKSRDEKQAWDWFFARRDAYEYKTWGSLVRSSNPYRPMEISIPEESLNSRETLEKIKSFSPDLIAIYGTGLIGKELLDLFPERIFNLHIGIPSYFRGSSCNFWPIHDQRLECLGATVHKVGKGIDTGDILAQDTVNLELNDNEQSLAGKTLVLGTHLMIKSIKNWQKGTLECTPQKKKGRLYLMKDFTPQAVLNVKRLVESGKLKNQIAVHLEKNQGDEITGS